MNKIGGLMIAASTLLIGPAYGDNLADLYGDWRTVRHGAEVKITDCGDGTPCGFLVAVSPEISGEHTSDVRNPDPELRNRPLAGLPILWGYSRTEDGWREGRLYNPETGQTFRSTMDMISSDRLRVKGCWGPFCRTQTWTIISDRNTAEMEGIANE